MLVERASELISTHLIPHLYPHHTTPSLLLEGLRLYLLAFECIELFRSQSPQKNIKNIVKKIRREISREK
jgi:hypothetical protein